MTKQKASTVYYVSTNFRPELKETRARSLEGAQRCAQELFGAGKKTVLYVTAIFEGSVTVYSKHFRLSWVFNFRQIRGSESA